jgi:Sulfotransferase domain
VTLPSAETREREAPTGVRWPNFFVVGAPRCGTTSMWHYLRQHPEIFMSPVKEPHFFVPFRPRFMPAVKDERAYLRIFEGAKDEKVLGEASPSYLTDPGAAERIKAVAPHARILALVRDPVERAHSDYWHKVRYGVERRSFLEVVRTGLAEETTTILIGRYPTSLQRYYDAFGPNVLVLVFEEFAADVRGAVRQVLEFLEVDPGLADEFDATPRNPSALPRNAISRRVYSSVRLRNLGRAVVPETLHARVERMLLRRRRPQPIDPEARRLLEETYRPDVERLAELLGRPLPWPTARGLSGPTPS